MKFTVVQDAVHTLSEIPKGVGFETHTGTIGVVLTTDFTIAPPMQLIMIDDDKWDITQLPQNTKITKEFPFVEITMS